MKWQLYILVALGNWFLFPPGNLLLGVVGFIPLKLVLMFNLIALRLIWLLKARLRFLDWTMGILFSSVAKIASIRPPGFVPQGESGLVCRLCCSLYGLKQSPWVWFKRFSTVVQELSLTRSEADHSVFYHHTSHDCCIYLVFHVDDIVITGSDQVGIH